MLLQILRVIPGHADRRRLGEIVEDREPVMRGVVFRGSVRHLDHQPAGLRDQQGQGVMRGDEMRVDGEAEQVKAVLQIVLPDRLVPLE